MKRNRLGVNPLTSSGVSISWSGICSALLITIQLLSVSARADEALTKPITLEIAPDTPLEEALIKWGAESGFQVMMSTDKVRQTKTGGTRGAQPADHALAALLRDSGLSYTVEGHTIHIVPVGLSVSADSATTTSSVPPKKAKAGTANESTEARHPDIEEVIVTAQKREERLRDVPISISVMSGETLDKSTVQGITEALTEVPGVAAVAHSQSGGTLVTIRGVTASGPIFGGASPVAYYLDTVPFGLVQTAIAPDTSAYDLARVEVLRGPQGTLYGANAQNGVVRVLTQDAKLNAFEFKARGSYSDTQGGSANYHGDLAVNVPIVEGKLAARAVLGYEDMSGWIDNPIKDNANDAIVRNARLKLNAQPTDQLAIAASAWISRQHYGAPNYSDDAERTLSMIDESIAIDYDAYSVKVSYDLPSFTVTSMTSYLDYKNAGAYDLINEGVPTSLADFTAFHAHVSSEEINLNSTLQGPWRWTAGAIYRDGTDKTVAAVPGAFLGGWSNTSRSYALFGELSRRFYGDQLEWTLGGRYFHDDVVSREEPDAPPINPPNYYREQAAFHAVTPRAVLTWFPRPGVTVYGSYSEGFRSGSPQTYYVPLGVPGVIPPVKPDKLHNYEVGSKADLYEGHLSLDTALYYIKWKDVQQQLNVPYGDVPGGVTALVNAPSVSGVGVDFGLTVRPFRGLDLHVGFDWNNLEADRDVTSAGGVVLFAKGDRLNFSPQYTIDTSADYSFPLGSSGYTGRFSASGNYTSIQGFRTIVGGQQSLAFGEPILIVRTALSVQAPQNWEATVYADNLNNEKRPVYGDPFAGIPLPTAYVRVRPRTVGLQIDYHFGRD